MDLNFGWLFSRCIAEFRLEETASKASESLLQLKCENVAIKRFASGVRLQYRALWPQAYPAVLQVDFAPTQSGCTVRMSIEMGALSHLTTSISLAMTAFIIFALPFAIVKEVLQIHDRMGVAHVVLGLLTPAIPFGVVMFIRSFTLRRNRWDTQNLIRCANAALRNVSNGTKECSDGPTD